MRLVVTIGCALVVAAHAQPADAKPIWKAVPGHKGVFVDIRSIVHVDTSQLDYRRCVTGGRGPLHPCLPSPDTKADIKVDGAISKDTRFYCAKTGVEVGDMHFGTVGSPDHVIPVGATKLIVCGSTK